MRGSEKQDKFPMIDQAQTIYFALLVQWSSIGHATTHVEYLKAASQGQKYFNEFIDHFLV